MSSKQKQKKLKKDIKNDDESLRAGKREGLGQNKLE
jgi:hypothetical protein